MKSKHTRAPIAANTGIEINQKAINKIKYEN